MFDISPIQILMVLAIALLVFGPSRLPEMGRTIGRGLREFRGSIGGITDELTGASTEKPDAGFRPAGAPQPIEPPTADEPATPAAAGPTTAAPTTADAEADPVIVPGDQRP